MWIIPGHLEYNPVKVPEVVTSFGKSSAVPEDPDELLDVNVSAHFSGKDTLGAFVDDLLRRGHRWNHGSPDEQTTKHKREAEREARERDEERRQQEAIEARIAEMNGNSAPPEAAYGAHTVHTEDGGPFVWAILTQCGSCEYPMLLWNAQSARAGVQHAVTSELTTGPGTRMDAVAPRSRPARNHIQSDGGRISVAFPQRI